MSGSFVMLDGQAVALVAVSPRVMVADATVTVTDTSQSLAQLWTAATGAALPTAALVAELQPQGGSVRLRRSGQAVSGSTGRLLLDSDVMIVDTPLADLRLIRAAGANVALNVALFDRV